MLLRYKNRHHKNKKTLKVQWNTIERPEINPYIYGQLNFNKGATIQSEK